MRLQCFRLQKTQLGRKLLRVCCSNLDRTPSTSGLCSRQWLWRICKFGTSWGCCFSVIVMHLLRAGSEQSVGKAGFCCPRMRGGGWVVPVRGRGRVWLENKQEESPGEPGITVFSNTQGDGWRWVLLRGLLSPSKTRHPRQMLWLSSITAISLPSHDSSTGK